MKNAHLRRALILVAATYLTGVRLAPRISGALHLGIFDQPDSGEFYINLDFSEYKKAPVVRRRFFLTE